jgi:hypothetical protein
VSSVLWGHTVNTELLRTRSNLHRYLAGRDVQTCNAFEVRRPQPSRPVHRLQTHPFFTRLFRSPPVLP